MMRFSLLILILFSQFKTFPQNHHWLRGEIVFSDINNVDIKQGGIEVYIKETGDNTTTDNNGLFSLYLREDFNRGEKVTLGIEKEGWDIQYPLDGKIYLPSAPEKELIKIKILPKGSLLWLSHDHLQKTIEDLVSERSKEKTILVSQERKPELETTLKEWATKWGFGYEDVKQALNRWFEEIKIGHNNFYDRGLAESIKENYQIAAGFFNKSAYTRINQFRIIDEDFTKISEERKSLVEETIRDLDLAGESYYNANNYDSSLAAYKNAIEFIKYAEDWETLASTLNKVATCYYYLSLKSDDESKFQQLDSANSYLRRGLDLSQTKLLEDWEWKFKGNLATLVAEREQYSVQSAKPKKLFGAIKELELVFENREKDSDSKDVYLSKNNIGICYHLLYEFIDSLLLAERYLDSSLISYSSILNDSSFKYDYPLEWAYVNNNFALSIINKAKLTYNVPSLYEYLTYKILVKSNLCVSNPSLERLGRNHDMYIEQLENIYKTFLDSEKIFRGDEKTFELASVLNAIAWLRIRLITYSQDHISEKFFNKTDSIINVANNLALEGGLAREEMNSLMNYSLLEILEYLHGAKSPQDKIVRSINKIENVLYKKPILEFYSVSLKRLLVIYYLIRYSTLTSDDEKDLYFTKALNLNYHILNTYKILGYFREMETAKNMGRLIEFIKHPGDR